MAVYNGARFLPTQLQSILAQLGVNDEIIVIDDCSSDRSVEVVRSFADARTRLHINEVNLGVLATFEKALSLARGSIIFLSDQDDIWLPGKVENILSTFSESAAVTLVVTDARLIDEHGELLADSFFATRGRFSDGLLANLVKNKHLGCTMAFRRQMLGMFLPIPRDIPMHDIWFGLVNAIYGKAYFIPQPYVAYRRHGGNVSPHHHANLIRIVCWRWQLIKHLLGRILRVEIRRYRDRAVGGVPHDT